MSKLNELYIRKIIVEEIKNYYYTLGIPATINPNNPVGSEATNDQNVIKTAYRKKSMQNHPDRGGNMEKMKEINIAANVLRNPTEKEEHDKDLYSDAVYQKKRSPRANFSTKTGMSLSNANIKNLANMANINENSSVDNSRIEFHFKILKRNLIKSISTKISEAYEMNNDNSGKELIKVLFEISNIENNDLSKLKLYKKFL